MCCVLQCFGGCGCVDVVDVNLIMGAIMDSLVVNVVEVNVIMGAGAFASILFRCK